MDNKNNRKSLAILASSLIGIGLISCGLIYQLLTRQCVLLTCAPSRIFTIYDLTLPADLYPSNAIINPMISSPESPGSDSGDINIYWEENEHIYKSIFVVERFGSENRAIKYFDTVKIWRDQGSFHSHPDVTYRSQIADDYEIGCGTPSLGGEYVCDLDARYEEFVISLNASITEQMSEEGFQEVVISLDKQFEMYLSK